MGVDSRDWYRDWLRKKTGYVERASFRVSEADRSRQKYRGAWRRNFCVLGALVVAFVAVVWLLKRV